MALCPEGCTSGSGGDSSGSEAGSICLRFGVRSYLHHFYEECSSSMWEKDPEKQESIHSQKSAQKWNSAFWKVYLALVLLMLAVIAVSLAIAYSAPQKIESFGEGDLFFVDPQAISYNRGLHFTSMAEILLWCVVVPLALIGVAVCVLWCPPLAMAGRKDQRGELGSKGKGFKEGEEVITKPPDAEEGKIPFTLAKVKNVQPSS